MHKKDCAKACARARTAIPHRISLPLPLSLSRSIFSSLSPPKSSHLTPRAAAHDPGQPQTPIHKVHARQATQRCIKKTAQKHARVRALQHRTEDPCLSRFSRSIFPSLTLPHYPPPLILSPPSLSHTHLKLTDTPRAHTVVVPLRLTSDPTLSYTRICLP